MKQTKRDNYECKCYFFAPLDNEFGYTYDDMMDAVYNELKECCDLEFDVEHQIDFRFGEPCYNNKATYKRVYLEYHIYNKNDLDKLFDYIKTNSMFKEQHIRVKVFFHNEDEE